MKHVMITAAVILGITGSTFAQDGYNPNSFRTVHNSDMMYRKTVWRAMDLREKQNLPLFSKNQEITSVILKAFSDGIVQGFTNDSLASKVLWNDLREKLIIPSTRIPVDTTDAFLEYGAEWRKQIAPEVYFTGRDIYQIEIKEEILFDKQRSVMYRDIQTITVFIPADHPENVKGIQETIATFRYKDLIEHVFTDNPKARWVSQENDAASKSLNDAFDLSLFSSYIVKVSNGKDQYLSDVYGSEYKGLLASQSTAAALMEYEHHLWEY
ncbi:MAG: gliding motility protein GldN [Cytophagales bacterium]|nr:gliding motility protein GldN [Cytophaga sp.]